MIKHSRYAQLRSYSKAMKINRLLKFYESKGYKFFTDAQPPQLAQPQQVIDSSSSEDSAQNLQGDDDDDQPEFNLSDYIKSLPPAQKAEFKRQNKDIPPIFFMTKKEKKQYFKDQNRKFAVSIEKVPQRKSKTKQIVKFKTQFDVKPFSDTQKVTIISNTNTFLQKYHKKIHFS